MKKVFALFIIAVSFLSFVGIAQAARQQKKVAPQKERIVPRKVEIDTNADGKPDRIENYDIDGAITSIEADTDYNGTTNEWLYYEKAKLIKAAKDTNGDGKQDTWITY